MDAEAVEKTGRSISSGFGLWGTIDHLNGIKEWNHAKHDALVRGWIAGCHDEGLTDTDAAALGDYKIGRWFVDNASFWAKDSPRTIERKAREDTRKLIRDMLRNESPSTIRGLKRALTTHYTDIYPASPAYTKRVFGE